jgi:hypothetical protein
MNEWFENDEMWTALEPFLFNEGRISSELTTRRIV